MASSTMRPLATLGSAESWPATHLPCGVSMSTITMKNGRSRVASRYFDFSASSSTREVISSTSSVADSSSWETSRLPIGPSKSSGDRMCGSQRSQSPLYGWAT